MNWDNLDKNSIDAATMANVINGLGDVTNNMNNQFGSEDWNNEWNSISSAISSTSEIAD